MAKASKKDFLEAYELSLANITTACKRLGISRQTYYNWLNNDSDFAEAVGNIQEGLLDFAESMLLKKIKEGGTTELIFYLKTKGKKRGYVERQEIAGADGNKLDVSIEIVDTAKD
jgi:hypothetical protein